MIKNNSLKEYYNKKYSIITYSGTLAIEGVLRALNLENNSKVLISSLTCYSVLQAIINANLKPVIAIPQNGFLFNKEELEGIFKRENIKVYIAVHQYGYYQEFPHDKNVIVIEDCSQAWNITKNNKKIDYYGDYIIQSFGKTKPLSYGIGGIICTNKDIFKYFDFKNRDDRNKDYPLLEYIYPKTINEQKLMIKGNDKVKSARIFVEQMIKVLDNNELFTILSNGEYNPSYQRLVLMIKESDKNIVSNILEKALPKKYEKYSSINAYRVKYDVETIEKINNKELLDIIKVDTLKKNNIGHSNTNIYEVECRNGNKAILKIQELSIRSDLKDEYERIKWLQGKCNVPKIFYYKEKGNKKYLLMEKMEGIPVYKSDHFAYEIGKLLKNIHNIDISDCKFNQNNIYKLLENAIDNIDEIYPQIQESYPDMSKQDVIDFLNDKKPTDRVLIHGDYSLPNIIMDDKGKLGVIDLGDVSISSEYYDLYHLKKSMIRNKKMDYWEELLNGYGKKELDEEKLKWIEIIDKALF